MIEKKIEQDLKTAMIARDTLRVDTLRGLKSVFLYSRVASGDRTTVLTDDQVISMLAKESKKRQESADLYIEGNDKVRADKELAEKAIIDSYLPKKLSEKELIKIVDEILAKTEDDQKNLGNIIGKVKAQTSGSADGGDIARLVKERLT